MIDRHRPNVNINYKFNHIKIIIIVKYTKHTLISFISVSTPHTLATRYSQYTHRKLSINNLLYLCQMSIKSITHNFCYFCVLYQPSIYIQSLHTSTKFIQMTDTWQAKLVNFLYTYIGLVWYDEDTDAMMMMNKLCETIF